MAVQSITPPFPLDKLTDFDREMFNRLSARNLRRRDLNGVRVQSLNRLVKKGLATRFTGAFGEDEWSVIKQGEQQALSYFAVTGRIPDSDEDSCFVFHAASREEAEAAFGESLYLHSDQDAETVKKHHGDAFYVTTVLRSASPIEIL